jgi:hypothetical protein
MYRLSLLVVFALLYFPIHAQSPHGDELTIDCALCHNPAGWTIDMETIQFDHNTTSFELEGTHTQIDCKLCHSTLIFDEAPSQCISCHEDVHSMSVGNDCVRCHTPVDWLVENIPELHEENGFPLIGAHSSLSCVDCHFSETNLRFDRIGNECINCHREDYEMTDSPNHQAAGFSINCIECHDPNGFSWNTVNIDHNFFPLTLSHDIENCNECHITNNYSDASPDCVSCHQGDYNLSSNPDHQNLNIPTDCINCHTTEPDWIPASFDIHNDYYQLNGAHMLMANDCIECHNGDYNNTPETCVGCHQDDFDNATDPNHIIADFPTDCIECHSEDSWDPATYDHDALFPIYSGDHLNEWDACIDCHINPSNFNEYTCITCHENTETDDQHNGISGYIYESEACYACHPTGSAEEGFNHDETLFSLTGGHLGVECIECHADGYAGTPTDCNSCHNTDFLNTTNPDHNSIGITTECISCHTTEPGWMPATFDNHNDYYQLNGAHAIIAGNCVDCHNGDYNNTPITCVGCHQSDYDDTSDPNHSGSQFPTDCIACHTEDAWEPSTFDHDALSFPIYSGDHEGEWNDCITCHTNPSNYQEYNCFECHTNPTTDEIHDHPDDPDFDGYIYDSYACVACHY